MVSDDTMNIIESCFLDCTEHSATGGFSWSHMLAIESIPGGGKTRLLLELPTLLQATYQFQSVYHLTFNSNSPWYSFDLAQKYFKGASQCIAMGMLYKGVRIQRQEDSKACQTFEAWYSNIKHLGPVRDIKTAIALLRGNSKEPCLIAIDDMNKLFEDKNLSALATEQAARDIFRSLQEAMWSSSVYCTVAGNLGCSLIDASSHNKIRLHTVLLPRLSYSQQGGILDNYLGLVS